MVTKLPLSADFISAADPLSTAASHVDLERNLDDQTVEWIKEHARFHLNAQNSEFISKVTPRVHAEMSHTGLELCQTFPKRIGALSACKTTPCVRVMYGRRLLTVWTPQGTLHLWKTEWSI